MPTTVHCTCRVADYDAFRPGYDKALESAVAPEPPLGKQ